MEYALKSGKSISLKNGAVAKIMGYISLTDEYIGYVVGISSVTLKQKTKATTWTKEGVNTELSDYNIKVISSTNELAEYALQNGIGMTIKTPYVFSHLDKLDPNRIWLQRNYAKRIEDVKPINHYYIEDHFNLENEQSKELVEVLEKVTGIYNNLTAKNGWYDESEQRWVSFTYFNLYLKPSKKAIENAEYKVAEYTWNDNELVYNLSLK